MRRIGTKERRARLAVRHHLAAEAQANDVEQVAADVVGLHATDPATVFLSVAVRMPAKVDDIESALYEERTLVRMLGMRRTMFVVPTSVVPVVQSSCTQAIAARERQRLVQMLEQAGIAADGAAWLRPVEEATLGALEARGEAAAAELSKDVPALREQIPYGEGKKWEGVLTVSTRVLVVLAAEGLIVRGRPRGSWISTQYRWAPMASWLPGGVADIAVEAAGAELVRRWLAAFGPGTIDDIKWWTGWTLGQTKRALAAVGPVEVDLDGARAYLLPDDVEPVAPPQPWAALLPALDPTTMGWTERSWYLSDHRAALFDRSGNAGPTVWWDGRVVGGWAQRKDGEVVYRLLEDVGGEGVAAVDAAAADLAAWLGDMRFTPKFRTPLERELTS